MAGPPPPPPPQPTPQQVWFLQFNAAVGGGRPWADGTDMAGRFAAAAPNNLPWDDGCRVTTYVSGVDAMSAMRDALENVIAAANANAAAVQAGWGRGYVYIADWRFNCMRDLSVANPWATDPWNANPQPANIDQTAMGLVVRLIQAGVMVRIMVWLPTDVQETAADLKPHIQDHYLAARIVEFESNRLSAPAPADPLGVVALDVRTAEITPHTASHHQKMMVIRSPLTNPPTNVAFVGGVDLAYTRRSAPALTDGDWQSATTIPAPANWWPQEAAVNYQFQGQGQVPAMAARQGTDLPVNVYGDSNAPAVRQMWYDQHLMLEGPIVKTIEEQFRERWRDRGNVNYIGTRWGRTNWSAKQVIFSTNRAYDAQNQIVQLPPANAPAPAVPALVPPLAGAGSSVQMWRTIPLRPSRVGAPFFRGEFTVMAGIANAVRQARQLIWMFDQYFWSIPLARLLNAQLVANAGLYVILILPPHADTQFGDAHRARQNALQALIANGVGNRVGVYNMWSGQPGRGIYVHAKSHTYDNRLLVCGSANLNRRSFLCDTELACAVLDTTVVTNHQRRLWAQLFPAAGGAAGQAWPAISLSTTGGNGAAFFAAFQAAVTAVALNAGNCLLIPDPWNQQPIALPNNVVRDVTMPLPTTPAFMRDVGYYRSYNNILDPSSVNLRVETQVVDPNTQVPRDARLDDIVTRLENEPGNGGTWPWRK